MTDTAEYLACLLILLGLAAVVIAVLTDKLVERWRSKTYHGIADASQWGRISECEAIQLNHFDEVSNV